MKRMVFLFGLLFLCGVAISAEERKDLSLEDVIAGFQSEKLFYFESIFQNGKHIKTFSKCLSSRPANSVWMRQYCTKHPEFKNAFECADEDVTHIWFIYESADLCEEVRKPMKDKMDSL